MNKKQNVTMIYLKGIVFLIAVVMCFQQWETARAEEIRPSNPQISNNVTTWDCIYFGNYPQSDATGKTKEPIKWRVLSVDGDDAFLMADSILYQMNYDLKDGDDATWKNNSIRAWLNSYDMTDIQMPEYTSTGFLESAFTQKEQEAILKQTIEGCNDYVYLPSKDEMLTKAYGFSTDENVEDAARISRITNYAGTIYASSHSESRYGFAQCYYLRDFTKDFNGLSCMSEIHALGNYGAGYFWVSGIGVRPVLHLDLSEEVWEMAGTVASDIAAERISGDYHYFIYNDEAVITAYDGNATSITIPDTLDGYPVGYVQSLEKFNDGTENNSDNLKTVTFPDSVWGIGYLGRRSLTTVTFGKGIQKIGNSAFCYCEYLTTITIPDTVTEIGSEAFSGCTRLTSVTIPGSVKEIEYGTFWACSDLKTVVLNSGIETIGEYAFVGCGKLCKVELPKSLIEIDESAFENCGKGFKLIVTKDSVAEQYAKENEIDYEYSDGTAPIRPSDSVAPPEAGMSTGNTAPSENTTEGNNGNAGMVETPLTENQTTETPISVGTEVTQNKLKYQIVTKENNKQEVSYIGTDNKTSKKITIPASVTIDGTSYKVTSISNGAFKNNKKLQTVVIGKNVTSIGKESFKGCSKLKTITIKSATLKKVGKNAFRGIQKNAVIKVPKKQKKTYQKLLKGKGQGKSVKVK